MNSFPVSACFSLALLLQASLPALTLGQINGAGPSDPALFDTVLTDPALGDLPSTFLFPSSPGFTPVEPGETTQLNISTAEFTVLFPIPAGTEFNMTGGQINGLTAVEMTEFNISGGAITGTSPFETGSLANIDGGTFSNVDLLGEANITDGVFDNVLFFSDSDVSVSGGEFLSLASFDTFAEIEISGGTFDFVSSGFFDQLDVSGGVIGSLTVDISVLNMSGGTVDRILISEESEANFFGTEFLLDGEPLSLGPGETFEVTVRDVPLSGVFADGTVFSFDLNSTFPNDQGFSPEAIVRVTSTASPALLGDVNLDGGVDFFDIAPFIAVLAAEGFQVEADIDQDSDVDFFDIAPFIGILSGQ